jgi:lactoylglutathione lyase
MKFGYTIIYVNSVTAALTFYRAAFGFETRFLHESNQYGELATGETTLAFASYEMGELNLAGKYQKTSLAADPPGIELAFSCEDVATAFQTALDHGAVAISAPEIKPWGQTVAYLRDPFGVLIELCTPMA